MVNFVHTPLGFVLLLLGVILLVLTLIDIFQTVLYVHGGGPLSTRLGTYIWKLFFWFAKGNGKSNILTYAGGFILLSMVFLWISLIWMGYSLVFLSDPDSVVNSTTKEPAGVIEKIYFVGYTLTSLGNGTFSPSTNFWRIVSNILGMNTTIFISLGISYLLPVLQAVIDKRTLAVYISRMGSTPTQIIKKGQNDHQFQILYERFGDLEQLLIRHGERHLAYPILHYFHSNKKSHSLALNLAVLDEAISIQEIHKIDDSSHAYHWKILRGAMNNFYSRLDGQFILPAEEPPQFDYKQDLANEIVLDKGKEKIKTKEFRDRRKKVLGYIQVNGWSWEDILYPERDSGADFK